VQRVAHGGAAVLVAPLAHDLELALVELRAHHAGEAGALAVAQEVLLDAERDEAVILQQLVGGLERRGRRVAEPERRDAREAVEAPRVEVALLLLAERGHVGDEVVVVDAGPVA
jgi:hypothetical protein